MKLYVGMPVSVTRSDGRIQSVFISNIQSGSEYVDVNWIDDAGSHKKTVKVAAILSTNAESTSQIGMVDRSKLVLNPTSTSSLKELPDPIVENPVVCLKNVNQPLEPASIPQSRINNPLSKKELKPGEFVEIKRFDGQIHGALIYDVQLDTGKVYVKFFEANLTKAKSVNIQEVLQYNPRFVAPCNLDKAVSQSQVVLKTESQAVLSKTESPVTSSKVGSPVTASSKVGSPIIASKIGPDTARNSKLVALHPRSRKSVFHQKAPADKSLERPLTNPKRRKTMAVVGEIERDRLDRRVKQVGMKRTWDDTKGLDPGSSNREFFIKMIVDYRTGLETRPLQVTDPIANDRICVCVRKRPLSQKEKSQGDIEIVTIPDKDQIHVHQPKFSVDMTKYLDNQKFRFDYVFDEMADNGLVYQFTAKPLISTIFEGGFATCFAYGQTGSGKTHTMCGSVGGTAQNHSRGIYAQCANDVFEFLEMPEYRDLDLHVDCSFFELYGSKAFDLLNNRVECSILEDSKKNVQIVGLTEVEVANGSEVLQLIDEGSVLRTSGQTSGNDDSSRSHAIFQIVLKRKDETVHGKFSLIDLAGSERGVDTKAFDSTVRREGGEINKSLLALKECIRSMGMMKRHIQFRQSKLTLILRDSFAAKNSKICMIATISPGLSNSESTLNTLRYAHRLKELGSEATGNLHSIPE